MDMEIKSSARLHPEPSAIVVTSSMQNTARQAGQWAVPRSQSSIDADCDCSLEKISREKKRTLPNEILMLWWDIGQRHTLAKQAQHHMGRHEQGWQVRPEQTRWSTTWW